MVAKGQANDAEEYRDAQLAFILKMGEYWNSARKEFDPPVEAMANHVHGLTLMLSTQMFRLMRSAARECSEKEAFSASILARSLFETVVAIEFVLKESVSLYIGPDLDKSGTQRVDGDGLSKFIVKRLSRNTPPDKLVVLDRDTRSWLYLAHDTLKDLRLYNSVNPNSPRALDPKVSQGLVNALGFEWLSVAKHAKSYSGLSVVELVTLLDPSLLNWYLTVYGLQSKMAHGSSALQHIHSGDESSEFAIAPISDTRQIVNTLGVLMSLFSAGLLILRKNVGFGNDSFEQLNKEMLELRDRDPLPDL